MPLVVVVVVVVAVVAVVVVVVAVVVVVVVAVAVVVVVLLLLLLLLNPTTLPVRQRHAEPASCSAISSSICQKPPTSTTSGVFGGLRVQEFRV